MNVLDKFVNLPQEHAQILPDQRCIFNQKHYKLWTFFSKRVQEDSSTHTKTRIVALGDRNRSGTYQHAPSWLFGVEQFVEHGCVFGCSTSLQVAEVARWISTVTDDRFAAIASGQPTEQADYLGGYFAALRDFYERAAAGGLATVSVVGL